LSFDPSFTPAYLDLLQSGAFDARVKEALNHLAECDLCPCWRPSRWPASVRPTSVVVKGAGRRA